MKVIYSIEIKDDQTGELKDCIELVEHTNADASRADADAREKMQDWLENEYDPTNNDLIYLAFDRDSDGQHGYINRDGASPVGKQWAGGVRVLVNNEWVGPQGE